MAVYENRLLFRQTRDDENGITKALESTWAYTIQLGTSAPIPGRYRIRIHNVEFIEPEQGISVGNQVVCILEKWSNEGWLDCLEYIPHTLTEDPFAIEMQLNDMFKSFTTGIPSDVPNDFAPIDRPPRPKKSKVAPPEVVVPPVTDKPEPPDFEWI
jgi:hypothetical protein